ncbi:cytochrome c550 (plasmid) [Burkholderia sp. SFA1]|nr:cytochrome c550 [Burkholderia sp. SFA1]
MNAHITDGDTGRLRDWVLSDTPQSRRQAAIGAAYRGWLQFRRNWLAMTGLTVLLVLFALGISAPQLATHDPNAQDLAQRLAAPSAAHWFGTDQLGRDLFSRLLYGARITLGMAVLIVAIVAPVGMLMGTIAGFAGGWTDRILMRVTDVFLAFPKLVLALAFVAALKPGLTSVVFAIALTAWPPYARLARAETLAIRHADFISAIRLTGASPVRIILRHVMPLCVSSVIVRVALDISGIVLTAAGLGFLGMGAQAPSPEWGAMIASTRGFILQQWWVPTIPGIAIFTASLAFNLLGDGLRDVFDPKSE